MNALVVRPMTVEDVNDVVVLDAAVFGMGAWSKGMFLGELSAPRRHYRILAIGDELVGYAGISLGETSQVMSIGVRESHRRRGHGRTLLDDLIAAAKVFGSNEIILEVRIDAEAPQALYESFGFTPMGVRKNYYQSEGIDALVMHKRLRGHIGPVGSEVTK